MNNNIDELNSPLKRIFRLGYFWANSFGEMSFIFIFEAPFYVKLFRGFVQFSVL